MEEQIPQPTSEDAMDMCLSHEKEGVSRCPVHRTNSVLASAMNSVNVVADAWSRQEKCTKKIPEEEKEPRNMNRKVNFKNEVCVSKKDTLKER